MKVKWENDGRNHWELSEKGSTIAFVAKKKPYNAHRWDRGEWQLMQIEAKSLEEAKAAVEAYLILTN